MADTKEEGSVSFERPFKFNVSNPKVKLPSPLNPLFLNAGDILDTFGSVVAMPYGYSGLMKQYRNPNHSSTEYHVVEIKQKQLKLNQKELHKLVSEH